MSGSVLLDTNILIGILAKDEAILSLTVVSRDLHFREIENLPVEEW